MTDAYDLTDWATDAKRSWAYGIRAIRLRLVAEQKCYWTDLIELYAWEGGPLA